MQQRQKPNLFIIDINLGVDSGFDVAKAILKEAGESKPLIIFMSGVVLEDEQKTAGTITSHPILQKPMQTSDNANFADAVQRFLGVSENL